MKKKNTQDQDPKRKSRRLGLNRETVRFLDPALRLVRGGDTGSNNVNNCYPTTCSTKP